jgi:hypothetical protein
VTKFVTGQSGNPGGRPRVAAEIRELARVHAPTAIEELARLALKAKSESARISAIRELLDRGFGRPIQTGQIDDTMASGLPPNATPEEIRDSLFADLRGLGLATCPHCNGDIFSDAHIADVKRRQESRRLERRRQSRHRTAPSR